MKKIESIIIGTCFATGLSLLGFSYYSIKVSSEENYNKKKMIIENLEKIEESTSADSFTNNLKSRLKSHLDNYVDYRNEKERGKDIGWNGWLLMFGASSYLLGRGISSNID